MNRKFIYLVITLVSSARGDIEKRALVFPPTSLYGTFLAIAVPVDIPDKNVFVSYNFESNYSVVTNITELDEVIFPNLPSRLNNPMSIAGRSLEYINPLVEELGWTIFNETPRSFIKQTLKTIYLTALNAIQLQQITNLLFDIVSRHSRSISRQLTYTALETNFNRHGMNGKDCILRCICEAAETPLYHNGLVGDIMHIIFTPSASKEEDIDEEYYTAEMDGTRGDCDAYLDGCPLSIFDVVTRLVEYKY